MKEKELSQITYKICNIVYVLIYVSNKTCFLYFLLQQKGGQYKYKTSMLFDFIFYN